MMTLDLVIPKLACSACVETVTRTVHDLDPAAEVEADPKTKQVRITTNASTEAIYTALSGAGYPPS